MPRILPLAAAEDSPRNDLLAETKRQLGRVPNLYATLAHGPAALRGYLQLRSALASGVLGPRLAEQIALLVAELNQCGYCVAAHTFRGRRLGWSEQDLARTKAAEDPDPHAAAVLRLAREILTRRGDVAEVTLAEARRVGVTDQELAEITAQVALNVLSNSFNHLARPELDFPPVEGRLA